MKGCCGRVFKMTDKRHIQTQSSIPESTTVCQTGFDVGALIRSFVIIFYVIFNVI